MKSLPPEHQVIFRNCGLKVEVELAEAIDTAESATADELAGLGVNVFEFSDEDLAKLDESIASVADDFVSRLTVPEVSAYG